MKWEDHIIGNFYTMDGKLNELWQIAYYWINECGKTGKVYNEPRALIERTIPNDGQ
jgi:hypothetical protein